MLHARSPHRPRPRCARRSPRPSLRIAQAAAALLLALGLLTACGDAPPVDERPFPGPIIVFDIDTLRADHLATYGYHRSTSPRINVLASESTRFEWAFSQAPNTGPSHASTFTSLYPSTHGVTYNGARLPDAATTLAEVLTEAGYRTAAFVDGGMMLPDFNIDQGFDTYVVNDWGGLYTAGPQILDWLHEHADEARFFLWIHTYDVHADYAAPEPFREHFTGGITPTPGFEPTAPALEAIRKSHFTPHPRQLSANDLAFTRARYDGCIRYVDAWIGRFLDAMEPRGLLDRATIVLMSDHGEEFQEHGSLQHEKLYATVTRIPLLIRPPGGMAPRVVPQVVRAIDLMPTLLDGAGLAAPEGMQGRSLLPLLRGETLRELPALSETTDFGHRRALTWNDRRLFVALENDGIELYDFRRDPLEQQNLASVEPARVAELVPIIQRWQDDVDRRGTPATDAPVLDDEALEQLRALGYVD
ncbi:MAG: sulfatase [Acidobacteriota bacterium]